MSDEKQKTTPAETVIFDKPMTAGDMMVVACRGDVNVLANAISCKPGEVFTLNINLLLHITHDDVQKTLREAGFDVVYHDGRKQ